MDKYRLLYNSDTDRWDIKKCKSFLWIFKWWEYYVSFRFDLLTDALKFLALINKKPPVGMKVDIPL